MRVTPRPRLWWAAARSGFVCLALLLGLVLMHHAPAEGGTLDGHHHGAVAMVATTVHSPHSPPQAPPPGAATLLHLCLAVLVAAATLFAAFRRLGPGWPPAVPGPARSPLGHLQPRPPVPRVLAALGVLRR